MKVLIVENVAELGALWVRALGRMGVEAIVVADVDAAIAQMQAGKLDVILADLDLPDSGALAVADYAAYRHPELRIVFVTASSFFSDGSVFAQAHNACALLPTRTDPEDLAAVVEFHGNRGTKTTN